MSGLLFLIAVGSFVIIAYWAYRNDGIQAGEGGSGLLAMVPFVAAKQKLVPKWKIITAPGSWRQKAAKKRTGTAKPLWQQSFLHRGASGGPAISRNDTGLDQGIERQIRE
jgi:hypothetical protein